MKKEVVYSKRGRKSQIEIKEYNPDTPSHEIA